MYDTSRTQDCKIFKSRLQNILDMSSSSWAKLRRALLPSHAAAARSTQPSFAAHQGIFPLFSISHHPDETPADSGESSGDGVYFRETVTHGDASVTLRYRHLIRRGFLFLSSSLPFDRLAICLRLRREGTMTLGELKTAQTRKIDNTGNVCQWVSTKRLALSST
jgi:hypothetical protein